MEIEGHWYLHGIVRIEIEKVQGEYSQFVRVKLRDDKGDALSFACWGLGLTMDNCPAPEVIITDKDEMEPADAFDAHNEESDR